MSAEVLRGLLGEALHWDAEYDGGLSSHLDMALVALHRLGAGEDRLRAFLSRYARRLHPAPPPQAWPAGDPWRDRLGDPRAWPAYRSLFRDWLRHEGRREALQQVLPWLMQGAGAAAFHGPIRCAYALQAEGDEGLADALAYWACRWFGLGEPGPGTSPLDLASLLARLPALRSGQGLIAQRMLQAAARPGVGALLDALRIDEDTLPALARRAARRYAAGGDFTALHLVTGAHAMQVLLPALDADDRAAALAHFWRAWAAGWMAAGGTDAPAAEGEARAGAAAWPAVVAAALDSDDEHVVKLVDSCRELEAAYGGSEWLRAAARAVRP